MDQNIGGVAVVGDALIDEVVISTQEPGEELVSGAGLNLAVGLCRLGVPTTLVATLGDDPAGEKVRDYLREHAVALVASPSSLGTSRATSTRAASGEPYYSFNPAAMRRVIQFDSEAALALRVAAAVVTTCFPFDDLAQSEALLSTLRGARGVYVVDANIRLALIADMARFVQELERHVAQSWLVKISDEDSQLMYAEPANRTAGRLLGLGARFVLATYGADGAEVFHAGWSSRASAVEMPGPIVDTMGAGAATIATVLSEALRGGIHAGRATWAEMLESAMRNAAATCRIRGGLLQNAGQP